MKCKACSKVIPDGFTDCPWCGASAVGAASSGARGTLEQTTSPAHNLLIAVSIVSSGLLFGVLNYFAAERRDGPLSLENSGYFLGRCVGAILLAAILVFAYGKIRGTKLRGPMQALVILTVSSLLTAVDSGASGAAAHQGNRSGQGAALQRRDQEPERHERTASCSHEVGRGKSLADAGYRHAKSAVCSGNFRAR